MECIAIISDLHANLYALQAFLGALDRRGVGRILNLGDLLQIGPHPRQVAEMILGDPRFVSILGNNEQSLLERDPSAFPADELAHQEWTIERLGPALLREIGSLPEERVACLGDKRLLLRHRPPANLARLPLCEWWAGFMRPDPGRPVDWALFGHTHRPAYVRYEANIFLNPGALGCSREGWGSFCLLELQEGGLQVEFVPVSYDRSRLRDDYHRLAVPARERLLPSFHGLEP